jgi:hypothetical protein
MSKTYKTKTNGNRKGSKARIKAEKLYKKLFVEALSECEKL